MKVIGYCLTQSAMAAGFAILCWLFTGSMLAGDSTPTAEGQVSLHQVVRDLDMKIKVQPKSWVVHLTITNQSQEKKYLLSPLDLTLFRISLTDRKGNTLAMTARGVEDLTESAAGSVRKIELQHGNSQDKSIDLEKLFKVSVSGEIRCEISHLIFFTEPLLKNPAEKEWVKFPAINIYVEAGVPRSVASARALAKE